MVALRGFEPRSDG